MTFIRCLLITFIFSLAPLYAEGPPLNVGIQSFIPPFSMQGAEHEVYGYDIDMMISLCKIIHRTCEFRIMKFNQLLASVKDHKIDVAISTITITPERSKIVSFSLPYLLSYSRFLTSAPATIELTKNFTLNLLNNSKIGILSGAIFYDQIKSMGIQNPTIRLYDSVDLVLDALGKKEVDFILLDNPTAVYWEANSNGAFVKVGPPFMFGFGIGIAVNKNEPALLEALNQALLQYQASKEYTLNYDKYLKEF
jgi:polar amino acid transport system substrate-binding protein